MSQPSKPLMDFDEVLVEAAVSRMSNCVTDLGTIARNMTHEFPPSAQRTARLAAISRAVVALQDAIREVQA